MTFSMLFRFFRSPLLAGLLLMCGQVMCGQALALNFPGQDHQFLAVEDAFPITHEVTSNQVTVYFDVVPGHYLYHDRFQFKLPNGAQGTIGTPTFNGELHVKNDPSFGMVEVYTEPVSVDIPVSSSQSGDIEVHVRYQGCAEAGLCYPPETLTFAVPVDGSSTETMQKSSGQNSNAPNRPLDSANDFNDFLENASTPLIIGVIFAIGLGLAFTPCVLPMIPILMSIIVGAGEHASSKRTFSLAFAYVQGMAITYTLAGIAVGMTGSAIQTSLQTPAVLFSFAGLLAVLSLAMFGFYELQVPAALRDRLTQANNKTQGGTILGSGFMGVLAALLASPCITAPLIGILLYISTHGDPVLGGLALYALAMGMGTPQLVVAALGTKVLPKPGPWMNRIKAIFGALLLGVALFLIKHLVPSAILFIASGALTVIIGLLIGALDPLEDDPKFWLRKGLGISALVLGCALIAKPALVIGTSHAGNASAVTPFKPTHVVDSEAALDAALANARAANQPVLVDFYADWCTACIEMDHKTFNHPPVIARLKSYVFIKVDLTDSPDTKALTQRFGIFGPPAYLWFDANGEEITDARLMGFLDAEAFIAMMDRFELP